MLILPQSYRNHDDMILDKSVEWNMAIYLHLQIMSIFTFKDLLTRVLRQLYGETQVFWTNGSGTTGYVYVKETEQYWAYRSFTRLYLQLVSTQLGLGKGCELGGRGRNSEIERWQRWSRNDANITYIYIFSYIFLFSLKIDF